VIGHDRRRILHCNVTCHPTNRWIVQQLREAFPFEPAPRFLIFDRDGKYGLQVPDSVRSLRMSPVRTSCESPWQNGVAERWVESCRRDLLDHIIAVNERHLKRLLADSVNYYHDDRTHLGLGKGTPDRRIRSVASGRVLSQERLGGLVYRLTHPYNIYVACARARPRELSRSSTQFLVECRLFPLWRREKRAIFGGAGILARHSPEFPVLEEF
jgi:putative transposase